LNLIYRVISFFRSNLLLTVIFFITVVSSIGSFIFYRIELDHNPYFSSFGEALWWVMVSITTVGYGDIVPVTGYGRILATFIIFTGVALFSMFTALVSSVFVTQKLKEERGLKQITERNHILLCGWNHTAEQILKVIFNRSQATSLVIINQLPEDQVQTILLNFKDKPLNFIRGDFAQEEILNRANIAKARAVIIIPDTTATLTAKSDEKTILTAFSVKAVNSKIKVYAHIIDRDNEPYLKKAQVDDYIVSDDYSGVLLGEMVTDPGIPQSVKQLLLGGNSGSLTRLSVPGDLVGKTFTDAIGYFREKNQLPIAVVKEQKTLSLSQILTEDYSELDKFIEKKFQQAGKSLKKGDHLDIQLNPTDSLLLEKDHSLIIIE
jgi:voltage-gated potassium channel